MSINCSELEGKRHRGDTQAALWCRPDQSGASKPQRRSCGTQGDNKDRRKVTRVGVVLRYDSRSTPLLFVPASGRQFDPMNITHFH